MGGIGLDVGLLDLVSCTIVKNSTKLWVSGLGDAGSLGAGPQINYNGVNLVFTFND